MFAARLLLLILACLTVHFVSAEKIINISINLPPTAPTTTITTTTTTTARPIRTLPLGYIHHPDIKAAYKLHKDKVSWYTARASCISEGADLAVIDTLEKLDRVIGLEMGTLIQPWSSWSWIGIYRQTLRFDWTAVHGGPLSFSLPWANQGLPGNCAAVSQLFRGKSSWMCSMLLSYVCEVSDASLARYTDS